MGGGRKYFIPNNENDPVIGINSKDGRRDNRNLINVKYLWIYIFTAVYKE